MVNICCVKGCERGWVDGKFHGFTIKLKSTCILGEWIKFVNEKNWHPNRSSTICHAHFDEKFITRGKRWTLKWELSPIPTLFPPENPCRTFLKRRATSIPEEFCDGLPHNSRRKTPTFETLGLEHAPFGFQFRRHEEHVLFYNLNFDTTTDFP